MTQELTGQWGEMTQWGEMAVGRYGESFRPWGEMTNFR